MCLGFESGIQITYSKEDETVTFAFPEDLKVGGHRYSELQISRVHKLCVNHPGENCRVVFANQFVRHFPMLFCLF